MMSACDRAQAACYHASPLSMDTTGGKPFNPAYETFRKHSVDLLTVIRDPEVLAWELFSESVVTLTVVEFANNMMQERGVRISKLLMAMDSRIAVDPGTFDIFLSVLAKRPSMSDLLERMKDTYGRSHCGAIFRRIKWGKRIPEKHIPIAMYIRAAAVVWTMVHMVVHTHTSLASQTLSVL